MNEQSLNEFLIKGRKASDEQRKQGHLQESVLILQITSMIGLRHLPKSYKVVCHCGKQLRDGKEIEFYNHTGDCFSCDAAYSDCLDQQMYE